MKVLKFGAIWCLECTTMGPMWQEIEKEIPKLQTEYYEADDNEDMLEKYNVTEIPSFVFLDKEGQEFLRLEGLQNKTELIKIVTENLNK